MLTNGEVLALYDDVTREEFHAAARKIGLEQHPPPPPNRSKAYEEVWATPDKRSAVNYFEDNILGLTYLVFRGDPHGSLKHKVAKSVQVFSPEEAIEFGMVEVDTEPQIESIYRLAAMFPQHDPQVMEIFRAYATKPGDARLREATVNAMGFRLWPEFKPLLEEILNQDDSAGVKERARAILAAYDSH